MKIPRLLICVLAIACMCAFTFPAVLWGAPFFPYGAWNPATMLPPQGAPNQQVPYQPPPPPQYPGFFQLLRGFVVPDVSVGIYYGNGYMSVDHEVQAGQTTTALFGDAPVFAAFDHMRESDLNGLYLRVHGGARSNGVEILSVNVDTDLGFLTKFKQETASDPAGTNIGGLRLSHFLYLLEDGDAGATPRDNRVRRWSLDGSLLFPIFPGVDFLAGYKLARSSTRISRYVTQVDGGGASIQLPGLGGWWNSGGFAGGSNTITHTLSQVFSWHAPVLGARVRDLVSLPMMGRWYVDFLVAPHVFGSYEFDWNAYQTLGDSIAQGRARTDATGLYRTWLEIRGETKLQLVRYLYLDLYAKYAYLYMNGSDPEIQSFSSQNGIVIGLPADFEQIADQHLSMHMNFWGLGGGLGLIF